jgi:hypothetical protein
LVGTQDEFETTSREIADRALEQAKVAGEAAGVAIDAFYVDTPSNAELGGRRE